MMIQNIASNDPNAIFTTIIKDLYETIDYSGDSFYEPSIAIRRIYGINVHLAEHIFIINQKIVTVFIVSDDDIKVINRAQDKYIFSMIGRYPAGNEIHDIVAIVPRSNIMNYRDRIGDLLYILNGTLPLYDAVRNNLCYVDGKTEISSPWEFYCYVISSFYQQIIKEGDHKSMDYLLENHGWIDTLEWIIRKLNSGD